MGPVILSLSQAGIGLLTMTPLVLITAVLALAWAFRRRAR
jgi:hypothetical protein